MERKFYKTLIQVEILTEDVPYTNADLLEIASDIDTGDCVGVVR